tara:strand:- start:257 stop:520 length:264 start_codon:yes stop_codon:yes gene_type:complete
MKKLLNITLIILILIFYLNVYKYYSSAINLKTKDFNRININQIINKKISDLPILYNDTSNVIVFNDSFSNNVNDGKSRNFWNLLKSE